jgi:hypothetical protein
MNPNAQIDVVYTWVENTEEHHKLRDYFTCKDGKKEATDNGLNRYSDNGELKYSIRSVYNFAPWVHKIYIIADDSQSPTWLRSASENCSIPIQVVKHSELFGREYKGHLPTFNSQAIEVHLHRIPGLVEQFLYLNDDMFFGSPCHPTDFFTSSGLPKYDICGGFLPTGKIRRSMSKHAMAWVNNNKLLDRIFPTRKTRRRYPAHQASPMLKSTFEAAWANPAVRKLAEQTSASRFRRTYNIYFIGFLLYWGIYSKKAAKQKHIGVYHGLSDSTNFKLVFKTLLKTRPKLFCINDVLKKNRTKGENYLKGFMRLYFPVASIGECDVNSTDGTR